MLPLELGIKIEAREGVRLMLEITERLYYSKLESACKHDIRFMYVLRGKIAPDHNRFWSFIKHRLQGKVADHLFYQVASYLEKAGEINYTNVFIDGTKMEANANKYSFV